MRPRSTWPPVSPLRSTAVFGACPSAPAKPGPSNRSAYVRPRSRTPDTGLVCADQLLRLYFTAPPPRTLALGEWVRVCVHVANEFGCWRRADIGAFGGAIALECGLLAAEGEPLSVQLDAQPPGRAARGESEGDAVSQSGAQSSGGEKLMRSRRMQSHNGRGRSRSHPHALTMAVWTLL
eukprot:SAG11_NODE_2732_length_3032_cov_1.784862_3_plen_179_part_00